MLYTKRDLMASDKDALLEVIEELRSKLKKKNELLTKTRTKLSNTRNKLQRMKATVAFQRGRILQLYPSMAESGVDKDKKELRRA
jgi:Skp family chaperone for outer membrane proteins